MELYMQSSRLNDRLQILASVGVLIGLVIVAYEIRETNRIAFDQMAYETTTSYMTWALSQTNPAVAQVIIKARENVEPLSRVEAQMLSGFLQAMMESYIAVYELMKSGRASFDVLADLEVQGGLLLDSPAEREWYRLNRSWIPVELQEPIDRSLANTPTGGSLSLIDQIRKKSGQGADRD